MKKCPEFNLPINKCNCYIHSKELLKRVRESFLSDPKRLKNAKKVAKFFGIK